MIRKKKKGRKGTGTEDKEMWPLQVRSSRRVACVGKRKESSLWKTMALDRHTIASLEGSHYQVMGDRGEISERTHPNDARRQSLPTWRAQASALMKAYFFVCNLVLRKLAEVGKRSTRQFVRGKRGREGNEWLLYGHVTFHCNTILFCFALINSLTQLWWQLQIVNSMAESGLVWKEEYNCVYKTNWQTA